MSCVTGSVKVLALSVAAMTASDAMDHLSNVKTTDSAIHPTVSCDADRISIPVSASLVCSISIADTYVMVDKRNIWVTVEMWEQIQVLSNTDWEIV